MMPSNALPGHLPESLEFNEKSFVPNYETPPTMEQMRHLGKPGGKATFICGSTPDSILHPRMLNTP